MSRNCKIKENKREMRGGAQSRRKWIGRETTQVEEEGGEDHKSQHHLSIFSSSFFTLQVPSLIPHFYLFFFSIAPFFLTGSLPCSHFLSVISITHLSLCLSYLVYPNQCCLLLYRHCTSPAWSFSSPLPLIDTLVISLLSSTMIMSGCYTSQLSPATLFFYPSTQYAQSDIDLLFL